MIRRITFTFVLCAMLLFQGPYTYAGDKQPAILEAAEVAYRDFSGRLELERDVEPEWEFSDYVLKVENYDIGLSQTTDFYIVVFLLMKSDAAITGGGGEYKIRKTTFEIVEFTGYE